MKWIAWLLSLFFAFSLGADSAAPQKETDDELRNKVQEHLDVIVDESAAIVDEVTESIRQDERVQEAEQFIQNVQDVAEETLDDLNQVMENAKTRVEEKFGLDEDEAESATEDAEISAEPTPAAPELEVPAADDPVNG